MLSVNDIANVIEKTSEMMTLDEIGLLDQFAFNDYREFINDYGFNIDNVEDNSVYEYVIFSIQIMLDVINEKIQIADWCDNNNKLMMTLANKYDIHMNDIVDFFDYLSNHYVLIDEQTTCECLNEYCLEEDGEIFKGFEIQCEYLDLNMFDNDKFNIIVSCAKHFNVNIQIPYGDYKYYSKYY